MSPTYSPTGTPTGTPTNTPSPLPSPQGVLGWLNPSSNPQIFWATDPSPEVTGYRLYISNNGTSYSPTSIFSKTGTYMYVDHSIGTTFNYYYYVVATGTRPDSPASRVVHAISGTTASNSLTLTASNSTTPVYSITNGTVAGATRRVWLTFQTSNVFVDWVWGEEAAVLTSVNYGYAATGITYQPAAVLSSGTQYGLLVHTFNASNWDIDVSTVLFTPAVTPTASPTPTPTLTLSPTITDSPTVTRSPTNSPTPTPTVTPTPPPTVVATPSSSLVLADMECDCPSLYPQNGINGFFSTSNDTIGSTVWPPAGSYFVMSSPGYNSSYCARITGTVAAPGAAQTCTNSFGPVITYNNPFASMEANFVTQGSYNIPSSITGIAFNMKASFTNTCITPVVRFMVYDTITTATNDANGVNLPITVQGSWLPSPVTVFFNQMTTTGKTGGTPQTHSFDQAHAVQFQWQVNYPCNFDISVDNVTFITDSPPAAANPLPGSSGWPVSLIDNCEQGSNFSPPIANRDGGPWFTYRATNINPPDVICPGAGYPFQMSPGGGPLSPQYAAHVTGTMSFQGTTQGYPGFGVHFKGADSCGYDQVYDITQGGSYNFTGIQFYVKVGSSTMFGFQTFMIEIPDASTDPNIASPTCQNYLYACNGNKGTLWDMATDPNNLWGGDVYDTWLGPVKIPFSNFTLPNWATNNPVKAIQLNQAVGVQFQDVYTNGTQTTAGNFDIWIDDLSFY